MAQATAQETVSRLKELLFDRESRELDAIRARLADIQSRAGSDEQFQRAVALVLDRAIRDAETARHRELADAMSPMVLRTLRAEMSSLEMQDRIAGTMYPRIGEMVARYVSSAFRDLMDELNRRLEAGLGQNRVVLRLRSLVSGRSMAELALTDTQRLEVTDVYLVQRGSGALLHHWRRPGGSEPDGGANRTTLVSGFLAAITSLAEEAFEAGKESLRTLDLDGHRIYLRGAADHLMAARCRGSAPAGMERLLDSELIRLLAGYRPGTEPSDVASTSLLLGDFASRVEAEAQARTRQQSRRHGARMLKALLWLIGLPLAAYAGWYFYVGWLTSEAQGRADAAIAGIPALKGYPVRAHVERGARRIWVTGLAPDETARREVLGRVKEAAPAAELQEAVSVLPKADLDARLGAEGLRRATERTQTRLQTLVGDLAAMRTRILEPAEAAPLATAEAAARTILARLAEGGRPRDPSAPPLETAVAAALTELRAAADRLAVLEGLDATPAETLPGDAIEGLEALTLAADRVGMLAASLDTRRSVGPIARRIDAVGATLATRTAEIVRQSDERLAAVDRRYQQQIADLERQGEERLAEMQRRYQQQIADLERRLEELRPAAPTPRQRLEAFVRSHAIFFASDTNFRDPDAAGAVLAELADLIRASGTTVRVVGYTDEIGTSARNSPLSQQRADRVVADLVRRGVPEDLLSAVGRPNGVAIVTGTGVDSPNRRVEFEIAFAGERGNRP